MSQLSNNLESSPEIEDILYRAEKLREKSLYREALRLYKVALHKYKKTQDQEGLFHCMISLGDIYRMVGDFDLAADGYKNAIRLSHTIKSPGMAADAQVGLGLSLRAQGRWKEAIKLIRKSKSTYKKKNDREGIAFTLWAEAGALRIKGDIRKAIETFQESHKVFKNMKDTRGIGYCLCGLGGTSRIAGLFRDSLQYYKNANRLFTSMNDTFGRAYSYCGMGNAYRMLNDYKTAFAYFSKAVRLYEKIGDRVSYAYTLWGLSTAYKMMGKCERAHDFLIQAKHLFQKTRDPRGMIYCQLGFGEIACMKGRMAAAKKHFSAARREAKKYHFAIEECYAKTLISFMNSKIDNTCYNQLGLKIRFQGLPFNIP